MKPRKPSIVQAEFFHLTKTDKEQGLEAVVRQCRNRASEGSRIKTNVRFFDTPNGKTLRRVRRESNLRRKEGKYLYGRPPKGFWGRVQALRFRLFIKAMRTLEKSRPAFMAGQVVQAVQEGRAVFVMEDDFSFRPLRPDERHELLEAVRASSNVWVFLYEHRDLAADKQLVVGSVL